MSITVDQLLAMLSIDEASASVYGSRLVVLMRDPEPGDADVSLGSSVKFLIVDLEDDPLASAGTIVFDVKIEGITVATYAGGVFTPVPPWGGSVTKTVSTDPFVGLWVELAQTAPPQFTSEQVVDVEISVAVTGGYGHGPYGHYPFGHPPAPTFTPLVTYQFTCEDVTPPKLLSAVDVWDKTARVTFDDAMAVAGAGSVLAPAAWLVETLNIDPVPGVALAIASVAEVDGSDAKVFDLTFDWEQTPGCLYRLTVDSAVTDSSDNAMDPDYRTATFNGFQPAHPAGRHFDIWSMMVPKKNREEDATKDLARFVGCFQELLDLMLISCDRFMDQYDPDLCSDRDIDAMLYDMGFPFEGPGWSDLVLTDDERRKVLRLLMDIYRSKGTDIGIEQTVYLLLGVIAEVKEFSAVGWRLGIDRLGSGGIAQVLNDLAEPYDFSGVPIDLYVKLEGIQQTVTFTAADFAVPATGAAAEVVAVVDSQLSGGGSYVAVPGTPAVLTSGNAEAFAINSGDTLGIKVHGHPYTVTFHVGDFAVPGSGTAAEVATRVVADVPLLASKDVGGFVEIETLVRGELATLQVTGGAANVALAFGLVEVAGTDNAQVAIYSDTWGTEARVEISGPANAILGFVTESVGASGGTILALSNQRARYSFDLETTVALDDATKALTRKIADYMKPAHTHLVKIRTAKTPPWPDHWVLGVSKLGAGTKLAK